MFNLGVRSVKECILIATDFWGIYESSMGRQDL